MKIRFPVRNRQSKSSETAPRPFGQNKLSMNSGFRVWGQGIRRVAAVPCYPKRQTLTPIVDSSKGHVKTPKKVLLVDWTRTEVAPSLYSTCRNKWDFGANIMTETGLAHQRLISSRGLFFFSCLLFPSLEWSDTQSL